MYQIKFCKAAIRLPIHILLYLIITDLQRSTNSIGIIVFMTNLFSKNCSEQNQYLPLFL